MMMSTDSTRDSFVMVRESEAEHENTIDESNPE